MTEDSRPLYTCPSTHTTLISRIVLQWVAAGCSGLRCSCSGLHLPFFLLQLYPLQCVAVCCSVLQCVAVCCSVLQCVVMGCNHLYLPFSSIDLRNRQRFSRRADTIDCNPRAAIRAAIDTLQHTATHCSVFQCVAVYCIRCSVLQCVAVCCSVFCYR